jgi:hypothetical protein
MKIMEVSDYGRGCRFGDAHIYYVMTLLDPERPVSRHLLSEQTGIGEGSMRRILDVLKGWNAIVIRQSGVCITPYGSNILFSIPMRLVSIPVTDYAMGAYQQALVVHGAANKVTNGMEQRDRGIIAGADGASVFVMRSGRVIMPVNWDIDGNDPTLARAMRDQGMSEGDAMIITGASDPNVAAEAAIVIGLEML